MADNYAEAASPKPVTAFDEANKAAARLIKPKTILYTSALLSWMQPFQSVQRHGRVQCSPVAEDTCLMFPGHSKLEWTFAVNAWIFGAMVGSLCCGHFSDKYGRKKALMGNCIFMIVGGVVQASVSNIWIFALGRLIAGISSGTATATIGGYINELSPPHMRNTLGLACRSSRPLPCMASEPGRKEEAKQVIARLYGEEHVQTALSWLEVSKASAEEGLIDSTPKKESMFSPRYRMQLLGGIMLIFSTRYLGLRVGTLIIDFINIFPAFFTVCWPTASALAT
ncbi:Major facilitator superfamily domain [Phytophthora cactorum]|nr:Major facilitator superfamily domain [Phytophthora cactorum]